jgi:hypothetical protein
MNTKKGGGLFKVPEIPESKSSKIPIVTKNTRKNQDLLLKSYKFKAQKPTLKFNIPSLEPINYSNYELLNLYIRNNNANKNRLNSTIRKITKNYNDLKTQNNTLIFDSRIGYIFKLNTNYCNFDQTFYISEGIGNRNNNKETILHIFQRQILAPYYGIFNNRLIKYISSFYESRYKISKNYLRFWHFYLTFKLILKNIEDQKPLNVKYFEILFITISTMFNKPEELLVSIRFGKGNSMWKRLEIENLIVNMDTILSNDLIPPIINKNSICELPNTFILIHEKELENSDYINELDIFINLIFNQLSLNDDNIQKMYDYLMELTEYNEFIFTNNNIYNYRNFNKFIK